MLTSLTVVLALALIFNLNHKMYVTLLPKSITTAIGMGVSEELGGAVTITVAVIIITGVLGNMLAETLCKLFHIEEPIAKGISIGSASHAIGTAKAMEMGDVEGAMSSLSIVVAGLLTVAARRFLPTLCKKRGIRKNAPFLRGSPAVCAKFAFLKMGIRHNGQNII